MLTNNKFATLKELEPLAALRTLSSLSLIDNPVTKQQGYRAFCIAMLPNLRVLDFQKVKPARRRVKRAAPCGRPAAAAAARAAPRRLRTRRREGLGLARELRAAFAR